jgi:REP element-mobilizing transposase RayT
MDRDDLQKPGYRTLRKGRISVPGQTYLVTTVCDARRPWFISWPVASATCAALAEPRLWRDSHLACWVLMPDHLHAIVTLGSSESLPRLLQRVKAITAREANAACGRPSGTVWMVGYHERALRRDEDLRIAARYLIANPLRAGLADGISSYPFWDAAWLESR